VPRGSAKIGGDYDGRGGSVQISGESANVIPDFNDNGYLPPGTNLASLEEIAARFGQESEIRQAQMDSVRWLVATAKKAGVRRLVIKR
jgi:uncharacterized protein DUF6932